MAKRRTYEQKLFDDLQKLPARKWFKIYDRPDFDKITVAVKMFIDNREQYEFSEDYKMIRRLEHTQQPLTHWHQMKELPPGITLEVTGPGEVIEFTTSKGKVNHYTVEKTHHQVICDGKIISAY